MNKILKTLKKLSLNYITALILSLVIFLFAYLAPFQIALNTTDSLPQRFFLVKEGKLPLRNDYVAFNKNNQFYKKPFIKQLIGLPDDEIKEFNNNFWLTTKKIPYIIPAGFAKEYSLLGIKLKKILTGIIPPNYYYVYAPHQDSLDSRYQEIGLINKNDIIGKAAPITLNHFIYFIVFLLTTFLLLRKILIFFYQNKGDLKIITLFLILLFPINSHSKDLGTHGVTYKITETDLSADIKSKLTKLEESGELAELQKQWQKKAVQRVERPKAVKGLFKASKTREFIYDPSIESNKDIFDHQGNIVVKKGTKVNPLHYQNLPERLLFINGDDKRQVKWAFKKAQLNSSIIILTQGNIMQLMRDSKKRLYFDQNGHLIKTFSIKNLPAEVYQDGDVLKVREEVI